MNTYWRSVYYQMIRFEKKKREKRRKKYDFDNNSMMVFISATLHFPTLRASQLSTILFIHRNLGMQIDTIRRLFVTWRLTLVRPKFEETSSVTNWRTESKGGQTLIGAASTPTFCVRMTGQASKQRDYIVRA